MQKQVSYDEAIVSKYPEQIVIGIARDARGKCNPITLGWTMITLSVPPMMAVSIGLTRYSLEVFKSAREFVIALPSERQAEETLLFGTKSGREIDKFAEAGTKLQPTSEVDCVLMVEAVANFELRKIGEMDTGDHVIFVGEVVCSHADPSMPDRLYTVGADYRMAGRPRGG